MATHTFRKSLPIKFVSGTNPTNSSLDSDTTSTIIRQYDNAVITSAGLFDPTQISLSYNGQQLDTSADAPTAKFYYTVTQVPGSGTVTGFIITIVANPSYTAAYTPATTISMTIGTNDIFFIDYTYTVTV